MAHFTKPIRIALGLAPALAGFCLIGLSQQADGQSTIRVLRPIPSATPSPNPSPTPTPSASPSPAVRQVLAPRIITRNPALIAAMAPAEIKPPSEVKSQAPAESITLRSGSTRESLQGYPVKRIISADAVRANPRIQLRDTAINLDPVLRDPNALPNVAKRLRMQPDLVEVRSDTMDVMEIEPGLVVRNFIAYRIKPGACGDGVKRSSLARLGVRCMNRATDQSRAAAFANPRDPHYIADPGLRTRRIAEANDAAMREEADVNASLADLRKQLANPAQRSQLEQAIGAAEVARISALDDETLKDEIANSAENLMEQVMFVPSSDVADRRIKPKPLYFPMNFTQQTLFNKGMLGAIAAASAPEQTAQPTDKVLPSRVFLTGFTLGRAYEWRYRIQKTIAWCIAGCKKTYFAEAYAGFTYGFGLRFPIRLDTTYHHPGGKADKASLTANFTPIDGSAQDYASTGLANYQLFGGKEFVAEVTAYAGAGYKLPVIGSNSVRFDLGVDFTKDLPAPFTNGQFEPPAPGTTSKPLVKVFDQIDLIGGRASFGAFGAKVFPAIKAELKSDKLTLNLTDTRTGLKTELSKTGQSVDLSVDPKDQSSSFTIGDPVYNLGFQLTPGINPRLYIDLAAWSDSWDWQVWFPQMAVTLPPGGVDFACHEDTICNRNYRVSPTSLTDSEGSTSPFETQLIAQGNAFDIKWLPQCADESCKFGIKLVRLNAVLLGKQAAAANKNITIDQVQPNFAAAEAKAQGLVQESQLRLTQKASKGWVILYQAVWSKRCSDVQCIDEVTQLAEQMGQTAVALQQQQPDEGSLQIQGQAGKQFLPKFQAAIEASKARAAARGQ